jgi:hypothetical protein
MMSLSYRYNLRGNFEGDRLHVAAFDNQDWADSNPLWKSGYCKTLPHAISVAALLARLDAMDGKR